VKPEKQRTRAEVVTEARRLASKPDVGVRRSLRQIAAALAEKGMLAPSGRPYLPGSVAAMIGPASKRVHNQSQSRAEASRCAPDEPAQPSTRW
jgi:hypothetical protein